MNEQALLRTVHRRLTFLCAAITASILCLFSCLYLYLAERTLLDNQQSAFRQDMNNLSSSLEQQAVITHAYLSGLEQNSSYQIYLWDHGLPFRFNEMSQHTLSAEVLGMLLSQFPSGNTESSGSGTAEETPSGEDDSQATSHKEISRLPSGEECSLLSFGENWKLLKLKTGLNQEYQVYLSRLSIGQPSAAQLLTGDGSDGVTLLVVSSPQDMQERIWWQRLRFLLIDLTGVLLLTLFASFFTKRMLRPLQESHDRQIRFIADASHELRTPLAVIRACMHAKPPAYEQTIDQECARMGRLIEDLLTLSRLEMVCGGDGLLPERQDVDLDTLLLTVYEQMELLAAQKGIRLGLHLPQESLPHILGDCHKLEQLLSILLQNALSYTPAGGKVALEAKLSQGHQGKNLVGKSKSFPISTGAKCSRENRMIKKWKCIKHRQENSGGASTVLIQVIDNGPGISDADKAHIFERFYKAQRSRTDRSHFGLGLCIAQEIAASHSAALTVEDTEGGGTTFSLVLKC